MVFTVYGHDTTSPYLHRVTSLCQEHGVEGEPCFLSNTLSNALVTEAYFNSVMNVARHLS